MDFSNKLPYTHRRSDPARLDTLAAAYAESGYFTIAPTTEKKAIKAAHPASPDLEGFRKRLELDQSGRPYRDSQTP
jgi:hypothetical protein